MTDEQSSGRDSISQGLLRALQQDEAEVVKAHNTYMAAFSAWDVAGRRYAAMREAVRERLGRSPYAKDVAWPSPSADMVLAALEGYERGRFRYVRMDVGEAVAEVLQESDEPLDLGSIVAELGAGGLPVRDARAVNAALINTKGVKRLDDGRYTYEEEVAEAFDATFPVFGRLGR